LIEFFRKFVAHETLSKVLLFLIATFIVFPIKIDSPSEFSYLLGGYNDILSYSIYIVELFVVLFIVLQLITKREAIYSENRRRIVFYIISAIITVLVLFLFAGIWPNASALQLQAIFKTSIVLLFALSLYIYGFTWNIFRRFLPILTSFQAILAVLQFAYQKSIGLTPLSESYLSLATTNIAKVVSHGTLFIRSYGTQLHPNILACLFATSILLLIYFAIKDSEDSENLKYLDKNDKKPDKSTLKPLITYLLLSLNIVGLTLTFSRTAIILLIGVILYTLILNYKSLKSPSAILSKSIFSILSIVLFIAILSPIYIYRVNGTDDAYAQRSTPNNYAFDKIFETKGFGMGPGTFLFHMKQFSRENGNAYENWEIQPAHNSYLLVMSEYGYISIGFILLILALFISKDSMKPWQNNDKSLNYFQKAIERNPSALILWLFLTIMLFDHYFISYFSMTCLLAMAIVSYKNQD
jgi:hypothetical protein